MNLRWIHSLHPEKDGSDRKVEILIKISSPEGVKVDIGVFRTAVVYLHGFPDMSIHPVSGKFTSRIPKKICEALLPRVEGCVFVCLNFSGVPGSDMTMKFEQKTVSKEVADAETVVRYVIDQLLTPNGTVHVVGLSTGAIVAALLRDKDFGSTRTTFTCIAGLLDVKAGAKLDFSRAQIADFDEKGFCMKEFWIPPECPIPGDGDDTIIVDEPKESSQSTKILLRLNRSYFDEAISGALDVQASVSRGTAPLLVMHGTHDVHVPLENGEQLFAAASQPKKFVLLEKANHLLSKSSHTKKALARIIEFIEENTN